MTFWEAVYDLRLKGKIPRRWRRKDLNPHLCKPLGSFEPTTINSMPSNWFISKDGKVKGNLVNWDGSNAKTYRVSKGLYELIDDPHDDPSKDPPKPSQGTTPTTVFRGGGMADAIRAFTCQRYIEPARRRGDTHVEIRMGDVHRDMGLKHRQPAVCSAIQAKKFRTGCRVALIGQQGQWSNLRLTFKVLP